MDPNDRFDVQRRSLLTPEGQIESAGRFASGVGATVLRRIIGVAAIVLVAIGVIGLVTSR